MNKVIKGALDLAFLFTLTSMPVSAYLNNTLLPTGKPACKIAYSEEAKEKKAIAIQIFLTSKVKGNIGGLGDYTSKLLSYGWERGFDMELTYSDRLESNLKSEKYSGIWLDPFSMDGLNDSAFYTLSQFIKGGGRAFCEIEDKNCKKNDFANSLREYFSISLTCESVKKNIKIYPLTGDILPWAKNLTAKIDLSFADSLDAFFITRNGEYGKGNIGTIIGDANIKRAVSVYKEMGAGEIFFLINPNSHSFYGKKQIDKYQNKEVVLRILEWLSGER